MYIKFNMLFRKTYYLSRYIFITTRKLMRYIVFFQQTVTNISCNRCGRNAGILIRAWFKIFALGSEDLLSLGDQKQWLKLYSPCWKKDCHYLKLLVNTTSPTRRSCFMLIASIICWDPVLMEVQVSLNQIHT